MRDTLGFSNVTRWVAELQPTVDTARTDVDELVYVGLGGRVTALDRTNGQIVWTWKAPRGSSYATVLVDEDCVLLAVGGYIYCLDGATGALRWDNPMRGFGMGVTSLATRRGSNDVSQQAAAVAANAAAAAGVN